MLKCEAPLYRGQVLSIRGDASSNYRTSAVHHLNILKNRRFGTSTRSRELDLKSAVTCPYRAWKHGKVLNPTRNLMDWTGLLSSRTATHQPLACSMIKKRDNL